MEDNVLPFEEPELDADDDLNEREDKSDKQSNRPKRSRRTAATASDLLIYYAIKAKSHFNLFFYLGPENVSAYKTTDDKISTNIL